MLVTADVYPRAADGTTRDASNTESTRRTLWITCWRWLGSASSKVKVRVAIPSRPVRVVDEMMWMPWSEIADVTSRSSFVRSRASIWMRCREGALLPVVPPHLGHPPFARDLQAPWRSGQSFRWTETPRPRVRKPTIVSPGTGVQQRASRTRRSSCPSTITPLPRGFERPPAPRFLGGLTSSSGSGSKASRLGWSPTGWRGDLRRSLRTSSPGPCTSARRRSAGGGRPSRSCRPAVPACACSAARASRP